MFTPCGVPAQHRIGAVNDGLLGVEQSVPHGSWIWITGAHDVLTVAVCFSAQPGTGSGNQYPQTLPALPSVWLWPMVVVSGIDVIVLSRAQRRT
jgi:hypothetical protein